MSSKPVSTSIGCPLNAGAGLTADPAHLPGELINRVIEIARHVIDVGLAPAQADHRLPAAHLGLQRIPVARLPLRPPVHFCGVALNAMGRVQQLAPRGNRFRRRLRLDPRPHGGGYKGDHGAADQRTGPCGVLTAISDKLRYEAKHRFMLAGRCTAALMWIMWRAVFSGKPPGSPLPLARRHRPADVH